MSEKINDLTEKLILDGTENLEFQEDAGGPGSSGRTPVQSIIDFAWGEIPSYGQRTVTTNATPIAITAAADPTLSTDNDYKQITGIWDAIPNGENHNVTQQDDGFTILNGGIYRIEVWASIATSVNNTALAVKFGINGTIAIGRRPKLFIRNTGEVHTLGAFGYHNFSANDVITLYFASDKTADITFQDGVFGVSSMRYPVS
jgi:hypothetical protein